jgi:hypothetical protein
MPTRAGIPIGQPASTAAPGWIGQLHPVDWISGAGGGAQQSSLMRGQPAPLAWWQRRTIPMTQPTPQGQPFYATSRPYSRGAQAHAPVFGHLAFNPIGAGIVAPYRLPTIAGPGARYVFGAIWFDVQAISTSLQLNPTVPIETINALIAASSVGPSYLTTG